MGKDAYRGDMCVIISYEQGLQQLPPSSTQTHLTQNNEFGNWNLFWDWDYRRDISNKYEWAWP